jgi:GMP synthase (glutamine-hydrolysing)
MNILIINNHTKHLEELIKIFWKYWAINVVDWQSNNDIDVNGVDLIVLSGGSDYPVALSPERYEKELNLIWTTSIPIIGICLGAEMIAYVYGWKLEKYSHKIEGLVDVYITDELWKMNLGTQILNAEERHSWFVSELGEWLISLAVSNYGYEVIKHMHKPIYGMQFHPEIQPDQQEGDTILDTIVKEIQNLPITRQDSKLNIQDWEF